MAGRNIFTIRVSEEDAGKRLDTLVASFVSECSRTFAANLIIRKDILVQGNAKKPGYRVKTCDEICGHIPSPEPLNSEPEPIDLDILYEDEHLVVVNKQPGLVVHPAPGHYTGTLVNGLLYHCDHLEGIGGKLRPGIVHRLDKDTSGTLVVAKNTAAHENLSLQFKQRTIRKIYLALVHGETKAESGVISMPIGRHPVHRKKMSVSARKSREAETSWQVKARFQGITLLEVSPKTGRTHQIRVHCAAIHHPVMGDEVYGPRRSGKDVPKNLSPIIQSAPRQMLHAWQLEFVHPATGKNMRFESSIPSDMKGLIDALKINCTV
ncbi:RluA family pseudouridine synthase [Desulfococcaceae bacterium HSG8]|nr:RluA family pseudouridine synthase [Desulfococcaceae bacterium HSG8]